MTHFGLVLPGKSFFGDATRRGAILYVSGLFHLRIPPPNKFLYLIGGGILIKYGILNNSKPHFFSPLRGENNSKSIVFVVFWGAVRRPKKIVCFFAPSGSVFLYFKSDLDLQNDQI